MGKRINYLKSYKEINLVMDTVEGEEFKYFRNIFNGPETTILLTKNKKLIGWGKNEYNLLGLSGDDAYNTTIFPPRIITTFPRIEDIKQISVGFQHTLILLSNSTVLGIGTNMHGELGRDDISSSNTFIQIQLPEYEAKCIADKTCSIEMIAAEKDASFFIFNYGTEQHVLLTPICHSKSYLDVNVCSGNGMCVTDNTCECFDGYYGDNCQSTYDCSNFDDCSGIGVCTSSGSCNCPSFATGKNCSIPVCHIFSFHFPIFAQ